MEYLKSAQGSLFKLSENEYNKIIEMIEDDESSPIAVSSKVSSYTTKDFLNEVFINEEEYNKLKNLLIYKQNTKQTLCRFCYHRICYQFIRLPLLRLCD